MTTTARETLQGALDQADANKLPSAMQQIKLGTMLTLQRETVTNSPIAAAFVLSKNALQIVSARVSVLGGGATAALGDRHITDSAGTPAAPGANGPGIAKWDGLKTITLEGTAQELVVWYYAAPDKALTDEFPRS